MGKINEANILINRALFLKQELEKNNQFGYFKPLYLYKHISAISEKRGDFKNALLYMHKFEQLQDSLAAKNNGFKISQLQQRFDAERYKNNLKSVEQEKQFNRFMLYGTLLILMLVLVISYLKYKEFKNKRRLKELELQRAKQQLKKLTRDFREKSELVDHLREENEKKITGSGEKNKYMEQLTNTTILTDEDWNNFRQVFEKVYPDFIKQQKTEFPTITPAEIRLMVLEKLGLNAQEMANMLGVNKNTIHQTRLRLRRKIEK